MLPALGHSENEKKEMQRGKQNTSPNKMLNERKKLLAE